jgi:hypothetical protein
MEQCDGLRGPLVIYDPDDPLADMYDVDDGEREIYFPSALIIDSSCFSSEYRDHTCRLVIFSRFIAPSDY